MKKTVFMLTAARLLIGYNNPGWKTDADGNLVKDADGNPIWISATGESSVKGDTISRLNGEAANHRKRAETAEAKLATYEGIDDPEAARTALQTVRDLKDGDLINKGKLDEVRAEITKQYETKISEAQRAAEEATKRADNVMLESAFSGSEFARSRLAVPLEMVRATFGDRFKVESGKIVAYDPQGNQIYSDKALGEPASFDEALEKIVTTWKHKDTILKAPESGGTGGSGGGGARGGGRTYTRDDFSKLAPAEQAQVAAKAATGEVQIVD